MLYKDSDLPIVRRKPYNSTAKATVFRTPEYSNGAPVHYRIAGNFPGAKFTLVGQNEIFADEIFADG